MRNVIGRLFLGGVVAVGVVTAGWAQKAPSAKPRLRIEIGSHIGQIYRFGVGARGTQIVTAGSDRTARLWDVETGTLIRVFRPPIGQGNEGELYAAALSPDGKQVVCGGETGREWASDGTNSLYFFDVASGRMIRAIGGMGDSIKTVAYSPDGKYIAVGLGLENGLRVFDAGTGELKKKDTEIEDSIFGLSWSSDGRLAVMTVSGDLRVYKADLSRQALRRIGSEGNTIAWSPDCTKIAASSYKKKDVLVLSASDLSTVLTPKSDDITDPNVWFREVAWSTDGKSLYAGGIFVKPGSGTQLWVRGWADAGAGKATDIKVEGEGGQTHLKTLPDGRLVVSTSNGSWSVRNGDGKSRVYGSNTIDTSAAPVEFRLSRDGSQVRFAYDGEGKTPALFNFDSGELLVQSPDTTIYFRLSDFTKRVSGSYDDFPIKGQPFREGENLLNAYLSPDKQRLLIGTTLSLACFDRKTGTAVWKIPAPEGAVSVAISGDGNIAGALYMDGTIRLYRMQNGYNTVAFFPHADRKRWAEWTRSGYYNCAPGSEDLLGWHLNRGATQASDFYPVSRFRDTFYRPDIIAKALTSATEDAAVVAANVNRKPKPVVPVEEQLPPTISILSPGDGANTSSGEVVIRYRVDSPVNAPVTNVRALVDGRSPSKDLVRVNEGAGEEREIRVAVPPRDCLVTLLAENKNAVSTPATLRLVWKGAAPTNDPFVIKPKLYVLTIGVGKFTDSSLPMLDYAAKDATDFAASMSAQSGGLYREVVVKVLTDAQATRDDIADGLDWLQKQTTDKDVAMLFLSGHGTNDANGAYHFVPTNFDREKFKRTGITFNDIKTTLELTAGKVIFFVDSCHSGNVLGQKTRSTGVDINGIVNELTSAENGVVVFTASTGRQVALEDDLWGNGAFTKAVIEGLTGKADFNKTGRITINMLDLYISERVKELTGGKQTPTTTKPATIPDFPIAIKK